MRIDSSGDVLVGKTTTALSTAGLTLGGAGFASLTRSGAEPLNVNRLSSDGDLAVFYKDSAAVGSIGTQGGRLSIGSGDVNLNFNASANSIYPISDPAAGTLSTGIVDLGADLAKFKDLYLSGGVVFGDAGGTGTSTSNTLDSYEEGTWTPACSALTIGTILVAAYTKIGRLVTINMYIENTANQGTTGIAAFTGLPFTPVGNGWSVGGVSIAAGNATLTHLHVRVKSGETAFEIKKNNDTNCAGNEVDAGHIILTVSYLTA